MVRKRLNIVFFSIVMIAATPRVMTNFNGYAESLYHKAETEWLHFLVELAQPGENGSSVVTPAQVTAEPPCSLNAAKSDQPVIERPSTKEKKRSRLAKPDDRSIDVASRDKDTTLVEFEKAPVAIEMQVDRQAKRHANRIVAAFDDPAWIDRNGRSRGELLKALIRTVKRVDGKAIREMEKEFPLIGETTTLPVVPEPTCTESNATQLVEAETTNTVDETISFDESANDAMLDAH